MKYFILLLALFAVTLCEKKTPVATAIPAEEAFVSIKKKLVACLEQSEKASTTLKDYAKQVASKEYKEKLKFQELNLEQSDKEVVRECRRKAFMFTRRRNLKGKGKGKRVQRFK